MSVENESVPLNNRKEWNNSSLAQFKSTKLLEGIEDTEELPPASKRKCTDCLMLLLFLAYWVGMVAISGLGYWNGNPSRLVFGEDHNGDVCNEGVNAGKPALVFPRLELDVLQQASSNPFDINFFGICAKSCPFEGDFVCTNEAEADVSIAMAVKAQSRDQVITDCVNNPLAQFEATIGATSCANVTIANGCFDTLFNTTSFLFRCFPSFTYQADIIGAETGCLEAKTVTILGVQTTVCRKFRKVTKLTEEEPTEASVLFEAFNTVGRFFFTILGDMIKAQTVIWSVGVGVSMAVGLIYVAALYCCVGVIIWVSIILCLLVLLVLTFFCYVRAGIVSVAFIADLAALIASDQTVQDIAGVLGINLGSVDTLVDSQNSTTVINTGFFSIPPDFITSSETYRQEFENGAYVFTGITVLYLLLICILGARINRAIEIFMEASHAIRANPLLIILPPLQGAALVALTTVIAVSGAFVITAGEISDIPGLNLTITASADLVKTKYVNFSYAEVGAFYLFFGYLWSLNFINGITVMITSGAIASWFWRGGSPTSVEGCGSRSMCISTYRTFRYHLGTVATGSLLIAIVQFIRYLAAYIQSKMKDLQKSNRLIKCLVCCLNCFLACAEKCIKFISRNGYIMCAIYGKSFCTSSKLAFFAIAHNLAQVATVTFLGDIIVRFGQLLVTLLSGLISWYWLAVDPQFSFGGASELDSFAVPVVVVMLFAWIIAGEILSIYDVAVDTILLSWCQDKKLFSLRGKQHKENKRTFEQMEKFVSKHGLTDEEYEAKFKHGKIRPL